MEIRIHKEKNRGTTLLELLVAVAAFSIFIGAVSGLLVSGIRAQRRILVTQDLLNQANYVMEYMGRAIRMAVKDRGTPPTCIGEDANYWVNPPNDDGDRYLNSFDYPRSGNGIRFIKASSGGNKFCQEFYLDLNDNRLYERLSTDNTSALLGNPHPLISEDIEIILFWIDVSGDLSGSDLDPEVPINLQPKVTIVLEIAGQQTSLGRPRVRLQTSISQRDLDVSI